MTSTVFLQIFADIRRMSVAPNCSKGEKLQRCTKMNCYFIWKIVFPVYFLLQWFRLNRENSDCTRQHYDLDSHCLCYIWEPGTGHHRQACRGWRHFTFVFSDLHLLLFQYYLTFLLLIAHWLYEHCPVGVVYTWWDNTKFPCDLPTAHSVPAFLPVLESAGLHYPRRGAGAGGHSVQLHATWPGGQSASPYTAGRDENTSWLSQGLIL